MNTEKRDFTKEAAQWDENPARVALAEKIFRAVLEETPLSAEMQVMDFGCGTGLLALQIAPSVALITGVDSARGMLDVFLTKAAVMGLANAQAILLDPDGTNTHLPGRYHLITSSMTLHHIKQVRPLLQQFFTCLEPGGVLCIADLDSENGRFHPDPTGVFHNGFERNILRQLFEEVGFENVRIKTAAEVTRPDKDDVPTAFSIFLISGNKPLAS